MTLTTRTVKLAVVPDGEPLFSNGAFTVEIEDEAAGEFVVVCEQRESGPEGSLRIDPREWPALMRAIDQMIGACRKEDAK